MSEETKMKKNKEWAFKELGKLFPSHAEMHDFPDDITVMKCELLNKVYEILNQLDEPETLTEEWIDEKHFETDNWLEDVYESDGETSIDHTPQIKVIAVQDLQNRIVPNLENTEEQAREVIHDKCGDEVLQNNIDYVESQGYVVIEKPTVPQFVADWHVQNKNYLLSVKFERIADWEDKRVVDWYERCLGRHKNNLANAQETIALMALVGYEVEKEPKYYAKVKGWGINGNDGHAYYSGKFPLSLTTTTESVAHTKDEWKNYGVYEDNADFLKAEELEK